MVSRMQPDHVWVQFRQRGKSQWGGFLFNLPLCSVRGRTRHRIIASVCAAHLTPPPPPLFDISIDRNNLLLSTIPLDVTDGRHHTLTTRTRSCCYISGRL